MKAYDKVQSKQTTIESNLIEFYPLILVYSLESCQSRGSPPEIMQTRNSSIWLLDQSSGGKLSLICMITGASAPPIDDFGHNYRGFGTATETDVCLFAFTSTITLNWRLRSPMSLYCYDIVVQYEISHKSDVVTQLSRSVIVVHLEHFIHANFIPNQLKVLKTV